ncbi:hypothetical protein [Catenuloplanes japonicus]|uniref:hypothetical protein n=1 Tax=Catenuloplanes japonicus TaxID=33876 RepID=UPI0005265F3E|nr:hypothetical protein [Catenuloplanes japonicus]
MITFEQLVTLMYEGRTAEVAEVLIALDEPERRAFAASLKEVHYLRPAPPYEPEPHGPDETEAEQRARASREWYREHLFRCEQMDALRIAGAACMPRAADVTSWLRSDRFRIETLAHNAVHLVRVLQAPGRPSLPAVARALAARMTADTADLYWPIVSALLQAAALPMPVHEGTVSAWLAETSSPELLRSSPWTAVLLPHVFTIRGLGRRADAGWPAAVHAFCAEGGTDRRMLLDGCLHRMREGDRQNALGPFLTLYGLLTPTLDEQVAAVPDYLGMLSGASSAAAGLAAQALRAVNAHGRLETRATADAGQAMLSRREKKLVRAGIALLGAALDRGPDPALFAALVSGLGARSADLVEAVLASIARHLPAAGDEGRSLFAAAAASLDGDLRRQAGTILGAEASPLVWPPSGPTVSMPERAEPMPAPIASPAEVADEVAVTQQVWGGGSLIDIERIMDAVVRFAHADREALVATLAPIADVESDSQLGHVVRALVHGGEIRRRWRRPFTTVDLLTEERTDELARQLRRTPPDPPPALLATPATVLGHVDPERVLALLTAAERDGWQPGPLDLAQALLRLPRDMDALVAGAERLTSPAGLVLARWVRRGGLPDPVVTTIDAPARACDHTPVCERCRYATARYGRARRVTTFAPVAHGLPGLPADLFSQPEAHAVRRAQVGTGLDAHAGWVMALPSNREIAAAYLQLPLAQAADGPLSHALDVLPILASADGACGPAVALCLAYGLAAGRPSGRIATVDAFLLLAARGDLDAPLVGRELGALAAVPGAIGLARVADGLTEALRAGAGPQVWAVTRVLVPALLDLPRIPAATADVLMLAEAAAAAAHATGDLPSVTAVAARGSRTRLAVEAGRLARTLARSDAAGTVT